VTRDGAVALIERMKTIRPMCEKCETASYAWARHLMTLGMNEEDTPGEFMHARGYEESADRAGFVKRCEACAAAQSYPWADKLDPDRVVEYASTTVEPFLVAELEQTLQ